MKRAPLDDRVDFVMELGTALHRYGTPAFRLEQALTNVSEALGLRGDFFSTPTAVIASLRGGEREVTRLVRVQPGEVDLEKVWELDRLGDHVIDGELTLREGLARLREIVQRPSRYGAVATAVSFGIASSAIASFLHGSVVDLATSFVIGVVIGAVTIVSSRVQGLAQISETLAALVCAVLAYSTSLFLPTTAVPTVLIAGLIALMPGLSFTIGMAELATQNLVAGTARLMGAATTLLKITFGVVLGSQLMEAVLVRAAHRPGTPVPAWLDAPALGLVALAFTVLFRARPRHVGWVALAALVGHLTTRHATVAFGPLYGVFLGGFCVSAGSNMVARLRNQPASITLIPGIILLVPGSLGYRSLSFMYEKDVVSGIDAAFTMVTIAVTLVAGLLFGNILVHPKRSL